jgi:serine protease Do
VLDLAAIQVPVPRQTPDPGPGRAAGDWAPAPGAVPAPIGDSRTLRVGQLVLAMGHPWGMRNAVTAGIVSGWSSDNARRALIAAHLELQPGNSGGPLADVEGCVIGVNSMLAGPRFALAVPSHVVERFLGGAARGDYV